MDKERYYPGPAAFFPAGPDFYIAYNYFSQNSLIINKDNAYKYSELNGYKNEETHLKDLLDIDDSEWNINRYMDFLSDLKNKSILRSLQVTEEKEAFINRNSCSVAVITNNRPDLLEKAVSSIAENSSIKDKNIPIHIFDDSIKNKTAANNISVLKKISEKYDIKTIYKGKKEKEEYLDLLESKIKGAGIEREILEFAFYGRSELNIVKGGGGNRNAALLMLAGEKLITFDDDTQYKIVERRSYSRDIKISTESNPEIDHSSSLKSISKHFRESETDIISYMTDLLGENCSSFLNANELKNSKDIYPPIWKIIEKKESNIKAVLGGIYGGKWFSSHYGIPLYDREERNKSFRKNYSKIKKDPVSLLLPENLTITRSSLFVTTAAGFDTADILPPFPPYSRNEDGIWAKIFLLLNRNSFIAHLPYAVFHETENKSSFTEKDFEKCSPEIGAVTALIIDYVFNKYLENLRQPDYNSLSKQILDFTKLSDDSFLSACHNIRMDYTAKLIERFENILDKYNRKPRDWANDVDKYIENLKKHSLDPLNALPGKMKEYFGIEETIRLLKLCLEDYSSLLNHWPEIWKAAVIINKERIEEG